MIIGITGKARAGKDTLADEVIYAMEDSSGSTCTKHALADAVKQDCMKMGLTLRDCYIEKTATSRMIMQRYGTEIRRAEEGDYWIRRLFLDPTFIVKMMGFMIVFITDIRYLNEADFIKQCGGEIWRIERPDHLRERIEAGNDHLSETEMDKIVPDATLINDSSKSDLGLMAVNILRADMGVYR